MGRRPLITLLVAGGIVVAVALGLVIRQAYDTRPDGLAVSAIGGDWIAANPEWTQFRGEWRVRTTFHPIKVRFEKVQQVDLAKSLCQSLLTMRSLKNQGFTSKDVYRVEMNALLPKDGVLEPLWPSPLPVPVIDGKCAEPSEGDIYLVRYPGELSDWELHEIYSHDEGKRGLFRFRPVSDETDTELNTLSVCNAVLQDQAFKPFIATIEGLETLMETMEEVEIQASTFQVGTGRLFNFGTFKGNKFNREGDRCVGKAQADG